MFNISDYNVAGGTSTMGSRPKPTEHMAASDDHDPNRHKVIFLEKGKEYR